MSFPVFVGICWATLIIGGLYAFYRVFEGRWYGPLGWPRGRERRSP